MVHNVLLYVLAMLCALDPIPCTKRRSPPACSFATFESASVAPALLSPLGASLADPFPAASAAEAPPASVFDFPSSLSFLSLDVGSSPSGAEESSLRGVDARDGFSGASAGASALGLSSSSVPSTFCGSDGSPSGSPTDEKAGDVADGGGVRDDVLSRAGDVASAGLLGDWSDSLGSSAFPGAVDPVEAAGSVGVSVFGAGTAGFKGGVEVCSTPGCSCCSWKKGFSSWAPADQERREC